MYFDTHAHYDDGHFDDDRDALLASMPENGVDLIVNPGCELNSSKKAVALADAYPHVYAAVGFHPHDSKLMDKNSISQLRALAEHPKVVAIGEIGLDYHYDNSPRPVQNERFRQQMDLARETGLPVIIHEREATRDCLEIIRDYRDVLGVFHCFSGSVETAKTIIMQGWYLSFTGVISYKSARKSHEVIRWMPQNRLMIETDAPYLAPEPYRGKRNSSLYLHRVAEVVGEQLEMPVKEVARLTMDNGKRFFGIR